jgi:hypothetical protein
MSDVHASIMAFLVQAALVTVAPSANDRCPSSAQVETALETHAPRLVSPRPEDSSSLTLTLSPTFATGEMGISLIDRAGLVRLYRVLPPPPGDRARDCAALADTVAFIVDRYFEEVELPNLPERKPPPAPPPPTPPPPSLPPPPSDPKLPNLPMPQPGSPKFALSATGGKRIPGGIADLGGTEFKLTGGAAVTHLELAGGRPWIDISAGLVGIAPNRRWGAGNATGNATSVRSGVDLALLLGWPVGNGRLYAGPQASLEMIWLDWRDADPNDPVRREIRFLGAAGLRTSYQYVWRQHFFARADVAGCIAILQQKIVAASNENRALFEAPPAYLTLAFGVGIWF